MAYWDLYGPGTQYVYGTDGDDLVDGSTTSSNSMQARMYGGNDHINVYAGYNNFVNGNWGSDTIEVLYSDEQTGIDDGYGGSFLGGKDNDTLTNFGGTVFRMNGNNGDDFIMSYKGAYGEFRGGKDNDVLTVYSGSVFGDQGSDTFLMYNPNDYFNSSLGDYAWVRDYTPGEDQVMYASALGNVTYFQNQDGLWLYQNNMTTMLLSGISSIDQVTLTAV